MVDHQHRPHFCYADREFQLSLSISRGNCPSAAQQIVIFIRMLVANSDAYSKFSQPAISTTLFES